MTTTKSGARVVDGIEYFPTAEGEDCQCARCGSSCSWETCWMCGGASFTSYGEDHDRDRVCRECHGEGGWHSYLASPEWCKANPLPGREDKKGGHAP